MTQKKEIEKILIVGGSSGIGLATAKLAAEDPQRHIIIASRSKDKIEKALKILNKKNINGITVDTRDLTSITNLFAQTGKINHLVITGSEVLFGNIKTSSVDDAKKSFDSKFFGPFRVIQAALAYLSPASSITLFSGSAGTKPESGTEILSAINAAVEAFSRALAISLAPIRVNTIAPGIIDTPVYDGIDENTRQLFKQFTDSLLIKRMGQAHEVAEAVMYLIKNTYVTGTTLFVDGGHVIS